MNCIQRILLTLTSVFVPLVMGVALSNAAYLNDIRVGEYKTHTRIVFELSETTAFERVISHKTGQLTIVFANTQPQLVRKIPFERTKRVQNVKFLRRQDSLLIVLTFTFDHFRYEVAEFQKPFRLVIDVHHVASKPQDGVSPEIVSEPITDYKRGEPSNQPSAALDDTPPLDPVPSVKKSDVPPADQQPAAPSPPPPMAQAPPDKPISDHSPSPPVPPLKEPVAPETTTSPSKGMQYYLVVGMVAMTIIILILLLLMIIFKQPKLDTKPSSASDNLRKQDKRIASLNAQIHEQLKRYDDA